MRTAAWLPILLLPLPGCGHVCNVACPNPGSGLVATVVNDRTGEPICDATVTAMAPSGEATYSEQLFPQPAAPDGHEGCRYSAFFGRPGTWSVRAERAGFSPRTVSRVEVRISRETECCSFVDTVHVEIR